MHKTNAIKPYLPACTALILTFTLIINIFFISDIPLHWSAILWLSLIFALIIIFIQVARAQKNIKYYSNQLQVNKERLTNEIKHRLWAEKRASESIIKSLIIDENIPVMLAYFSIDLRCRYHNRTFRQWFGLKPDQIDGQLLTEFSSEEFFSGIKKCITELLAGKTIHNQRTLKSIKGFPYIFTEQYVPHLDNKGKTIGFYTMHTPRAHEKNSSGIAQKNKILNLNKLEPQKISEQSISKESTILSPSQASNSGIATTSARIAQAIEEGEFNLYYQQIKSLKPNVTPSSHYEILVRMNGEENGLMPPGSFLPFVDQFKMMPQLDRWIVSYIAKWLSTHSRTHSILCLNIAKDTLSDQAFPSFIQDQLQKMNIPAASLCFEIELSDAQANITDTTTFSQKIHQLGCLVSLCSFNYESGSVELLDQIKTNYLKIDGSLICNILRDPEDLKNVLIINKIAQNKGIKTIAELVESDEIIAKLQEIGVDYAQGFGIAKAFPFKDLE